MSLSNLECRQGKRIKASGLGFVVWASHRVRASRYLLGCDPCLEIVLIEAMQATRGNPGALTIRTVAIEDNADEIRLGLFALPLGVVHTDELHFFVRAGSHGPGGPANRERKM